LLNATEGELAVIKEHVERVMSRGRELSMPIIDWQGATDMVVDRYVDRLPSMARADSLEAMKAMTNHMLDVYIDYSEADADYHKARERCAQHYIQHITPTTQEDELIRAGIEGTTMQICHALFSVRQLVLAVPKLDITLLEDAVEIVRNLMGQLQWSEWKECGPCQPNEVCMIAMWPFGDVEDHYAPSCLNMTTTFGRSNYWSRNWSL
jgi:hypothetical protein